MKQLRIYLLRRKARRYYWAFVESQQSGKVDYYARRFNETRDKLQHLDPTTPGSRLPVGF